MPGLYLYIADIGKCAKRPKVTAYVFDRRFDFSIPVCTKVFKGPYRNIKASCLLPIGKVPCQFSPGAELRYRSSVQVIYWIKK